MTVARTTVNETKTNRKRAARDLNFSEKTFGKRWIIQSEACWSSREPTLHESWQRESNEQQSEQIGAP
jgi:predicted secreted acid phosphatase